MTDTPELAEYVELARRFHETYERLAPSFEIELRGHKRNVIVE